MESIEPFHEHGWLRLPQAFGPEAAAAMRDAVWAELARAGVLRDRPSTWTIERPSHLQGLKADPVFRKLASPRVLGAIEAILEGRTYEPPKDWGAFFLAFPSEEAWGVPTGGWHIDARYTSALKPPGGVKTLALFDDVGPRGGATQILGGSHRLVHAWFQANPPPPGARSADMRRLLMAHPYIRDLHTAGDVDARIARFMDRAEDWDGVPLQVVEAAGVAGDVILMHPLTLHVAAPNAGKQPRFMISGGVTLDGWGWG